MGGILIAAESVAQTAEAHEGLRAKHNVIVPFHSTKMRCAKGGWGWLGAPSERPKADALYDDLNNFLCKLPGSAIACVVHRPGYVERYSYYSQAERWRLCKSAYAILVERAAKIAYRDNRKLAVYVEETGKKEDRQINEYHTELRQIGPVFNPERSSKYEPATQELFRDTLLQNPNFYKKDNLMGQIADLLLYPLIKGKYDPNYRPYQMLKASRRIVDDSLACGDKNMFVKYYCFDAA